MIKIALVDLCKTTNYADHRSYSDSLSFLNEENINYVDFATGADDLDSKVKLFHKALESDSEIIWFVRGGTACIRTLEKIDWDKVIKSNKKFYGLSDFTHFATMAVAKGATCYYGQGLAYIKDFMPQKSDREFIVSFLKKGVPVPSFAIPLANATNSLDVLDLKIVGGWIPAFILLQGKLQMKLSNSYLFIEYHSNVLGETFEDLGYLIDQLLFVISGKMPKGIILGNTELANVDGTKVPLGDINAFCVEKLGPLNVPIYFLDHFKNTVKLSLKI